MRAETDPGAVTLAGEGRVRARFLLKCILIRIDPVKLALRFSKSPRSRCSIHGVAAMIRDGGSF